MADQYTLNIDPELVRQVKRRYGKIADALREHQRTLRKTPGDIGDDWIGEAAITVKANMSDLATVLGDFAGDFETAERALKDLAGDYDQGLIDLADLNRRYAAAEKSYDAALKHFRDNPETRNKFVQTEASEAKSHAQSGVSTDYDLLVERLRKSTQTAATALSGATYVSVDPGAAKQLASPTGFATALAAINDSVENRLGEELSLVSRADSEDDGEKLTAADDLAEDFQKYWALDEDDREKFISEMAKRMGDPEFAGMFANKVGPEEMARILATLQQEADDRYSGRETPNVGDASWEDLNAQKARLMRVLGSTYGLATQVTGEYALPDDVVDEWYRVMTDPPMFNSAPATGDAAAGQNVLLASLLSQGQWDPTFMADLTTTMIDYERKEVPDGDWTRWHGATAEVTTADGGYASDPVAQLMEALGNNRVASQMVFTSGPTRELEVGGQKVEVNDYLAYMMTGHAYLRDDQEKLGRALALALAEVPGESSTEPIRQDIADITQWGKEETERIEKEQAENDYPWYVDLGHFVLDLAGLVPVFGEAFDLANAAWYGAEGRYDMAALSAAGAIPGLGYAAIAGKWGKSGARAAKALEAAAKMDRYADALPDGVKVMKGLDGTFQPTLKLEFDDLASLKAALTTAPPNVQFLYQGQKFAVDAKGTFVFPKGTDWKLLDDLKGDLPPGTRFTQEGATYGPQTFDNIRALHQYDDLPVPPQGTWRSLNDPGLQPWIDDVLKQNPGLTRADLKAVWDYTTDGGYDAMNAALRGSGGIPAATQARIDAAAAALGKLPKYDGVTFRGTNLPDHVLQEMLRTGRYSDDAFSSSSLSADVGKGFINPAKPNKTFFTVQGSSGVNVKPFSAAQNEAEILFKPGTQFRVVGTPKVDQDGVLRVVLEEIK